ncbi:MAG: hypothetical protein K2M55_05570 [Muribaculaceae bacterium]|nr:hypothetical protein [Muribaculaceae bacterium]
MTYVNTLKPLGTLGRVARAVLRRISTRTIRLFEDYNTLDAALDEADAVIMFDYKGMSRLARHIDNVVPRARKIAWYWNSLAQAGRADLPDGWETWTFDPADARRTGMRYGGQFYFHALIPSVFAPDATKSTPAHTPGTEAVGNLHPDVCFIGRNKGRFHLLKRLEDKLHAAGLSTDFRRVGPWPGQAPAIPYSSYIAVQASSHAVLEILADGQAGLSLRTLEAMALGCKLLTTNNAITSWSLYDPSRILVVDAHTSPEAFRDFLSTDGLPVDLSDFTFDAWLARILDGCEADDFSSLH